ncbi:MAG: excinuclease ABC subunit A [Geminicoccaceae bacterium]
MQAQTRILWLKIASDILIVFGLLTALASITAIAAPTSFLVDLIFWPVDGGQAVSSETSRLFAALTGGLSTGLGVLFYLLTTRLLAVDPHLTRLLMSAGLGSWFIVDSLGSFAAGAPLNVLFNGLFAALFLIPLRLPGSSSWLEPGKRLEA